MSFFFFCCFNAVDVDLMSSKSPKLTTHYKQHIIKADVVFAVVKSFTQHTAMCLSTGKKKGIII